MPRRVIRAKQDIDHRKKLCEVFVLVFCFDRVVNAMYLWPAHERCEGTQAESHIRVREVEPRRHDEHRPRERLHTHADKHLNRQGDEENLNGILEPVTTHARRDIELCVGVM